MKDRLRRTNFHVKNIDSTGSISAVDLAMTANPLIEDKRAEDGSFTETDLFDFNKDQQIEILTEDFKLDKKTINKLKSEKLRVKRILNLQKKTDMTQFIKEEIIEETPEEEIKEELIKEPQKIKITKDLICDRCGTKLTFITLAHGGKDYHCDKCGANISIMDTKE